MATTLADFGHEVAEWHRANWPLTGSYWTDRAHSLLGVTKVSEEAGELVGALTKWVEGRPEQTEEELARAMLEELGDVVIAAAGALRRINDLLGTNLEFDEVVMARWGDVGSRRYGVRA